MNVSDQMTAAVKPRGLNENLQSAAQIMGENDCGCVPVVDLDGKAVGMLTDPHAHPSAKAKGPVAKARPAQPSL
jgi:CBS domain-containing protein